MFVIRRSECDGKYVAYVKAIRHTLIGDFIAWTENIDDAMHDCKAVMQKFLDEFEGSNLASYNVELVRHRQWQKGE